MYSISLKTRHSFRHHDESENSSNQGNFLELLRFLIDHNKDIKAVTLKNAPEILKLIAPEIQKGIVRATSIETINVIIKDLGNAFFSILVDESRDLSRKEQIAVVLRYVNKKRHVIKRFIGILVLSMLLVPLLFHLKQLLIVYFLDMD